MNKKIAFDNRLCYERDVLRQHAIHHKKLQTLLPTCQSPSKVYLDSNAPARQPHLATNRKRMQREKERQTEIFTQNQRLVAKMEHILNRQENVVLAAATPVLTSPRSPTKPPARSPAHVHMPGIRLDSSQTPMVDCYLSPDYASGRGTACNKTTLVNRTVQHRRQQQIEDENRRLHERLRAQKPFYNAKKWDDEWQRSGTKFQHLHQNTTVGHLLPRPSQGTRAGSPSQSPLAARRVKARDGLPLLDKPQTSHGTSHPPSSPPNRGGRLPRRLEATKDSSAERQNQSADVLTIRHNEPINEPDDDEPEIFECGAFVLLEATTRRGVEITIEELQIEMRDLASGSVQPGDRGLLVRGLWGSDVQTECLIAMDTLTNVAQEIDDLEMMIKLETVSTLSGVGNFPRLSSLLTEDELQRLLLKLVQVLNVQLLANDTQLVISSRVLRSPSPTTRDDKARPACRPRTCPSSLPSELHTAIAFVEPEDGPENVASLDVTDEEAEEYRRVLYKQLAVLLNRGTQRTGFRTRRFGYCLVQYRCHAIDVALQVAVLPLQQSTESVPMVVAMDTDQIIAMLEQLQQHPSRPHDAVRQFLYVSLSIGP